MPVTRLPDGGLPATVLVCGDPARAAMIAERLGGAREVARNREYHSYRGTWRGVELVTLSHGVGAPGAAVAFEELIRAGVRRLIRVGTCGSFVDDLSTGDLIVPLAAAREDGVTARLAPAGLPALADATPSTAVVKAATAAGVRFQQGVVLSEAAFYPGVLDSPHATYAACGAVAVEMECAALFVVAMLRRAQAAGVLVIDGYPLRRADSALEYRPDTQAVADGVQRAIDIALEAAISNS